MFWDFYFPAVVVPLCVLAVVLWFVGLEQLDAYWIAHGETPIFGNRLSS